MSEQEHAPEMTHLEAARASAAAPKNGPSPIDTHRPARTNPRPAGLQVWSNGHYTPTPGLDPGNITAIEGYEGNEGYLAQAVAAFTTAHETLQTVAAAREPLSRDLSLTDGARLVRMNIAAEKAMVRVTNAFDTAHRNISSAAQALEAALSAPLENVTHSPLSQEIRSHVKTMKPDERRLFVTNAIERGDVKTLTATLGAPSFLSGLDPELHQHFTRVYREKTAPAETRRLGAYRKALELIETRGPLVFAEMEKAQGGRNKDARRLRGLADASDAAIKKIGE